jgi:putative component of membrane protein insertase Oxa1/YidC/SpoIIIJ protein YidD
VPWLAPKWVFLEEAFAEASSLRCNPFGASSFVVRSVWGVVFFCVIHLGRRLLRCHPFGASSFAVRSFGGVVFCGVIRLGRRLLQCDPFGASSFAVRSIWGVVFCGTIRDAASFAVRSVGGVAFCDAIHWGHCLCGSIMEGAQRCPGRAARGTCWWQCQVALTG